MNFIKLDLQSTMPFDLQFDMASREYILSHHVYNASVDEDIV